MNSCPVNIYAPCEPIVPTTAIPHIPYSPALHAGLADTGSNLVGADIAFLIACVCIIGSIVFLLWDKRRQTRRIARNLAIKAEVNEALAESEGRS